ncbi:hypothetical protein [Caldifermentibacillus hisashii]|uniref:hypothetical protein n=1 Tax=Caldifermentibacillus hisashii TaxID=996558 RepID=UPI0031B67C8D
MTEQEMLKEALEWQEHIRKLITATDDELYHKRSKVFDWLLEQAEKVEYWRKQHRKRCNELEDAYFKIQLIENQLHQAQAKAERYEKALEFYADEENYKENLISKAEQIDGNWVEPAHYEPPIIYFDKGEKARKALEGKS